jgi:hypothetical protein
MLVGLITDDDETAYWKEVRDLAVWCQDNNLYLNVSKTNMLIVNYRKRSAEHIPFTSMGLEGRSSSSSSLASTPLRTYHGPNIQKKL